MAKKVPKKEDDPKVDPRDPLVSFRLDPNLHEVLKRISDTLKNGRGGIGLSPSLGAQQLLVEALEKMKKKAEVDAANDTKK